MAVVADLAAGERAAAREVRNGEAHPPRTKWSDSFQFFVTNTYNIIIMVTKVKYNIIATNKI